MSAASDILHINQRWILKHCPIVAVVFWGMLLIPYAFAGPPFFTDDPEPVALHHWEVYVGAQLIRNAYSLQGATPSLEVNFGILPETQLHIIAPFAFSILDSGASFAGAGDVELGVKFRFVKEFPAFPQIGIFPHVLIPTGDIAHGLGAGYVQLFLPIWLQKSIGQVTAYGGGGIWVSPGHANTNYGSFGAAVQYQITEMVSIGTEAYHNTASAADRRPETAINPGIIIDLNKMHHILASIGTDLQGSNRLLFYAAYLLAI